MKKLLALCSSVILVISMCSSPTDSGSEVIEGKGFVNAEADTYQDSDFPSGQFIVVHFIEVQQGQEFLDQNNCGLINISRTDFNTADADTFRVNATKDNNGHFYLQDYSY